MPLLASVVKNRNHVCPYYRLSVAIRSDQHPNNFSVSLFLNIAVEVGNPVHQNEGLLACLKLLIAVYVNCLLQAFEGALKRSFSQPKMTASQLVNDLLHGMFNTDYLAQHTVAGRNTAKAALDPDVVQAVSGKFFSFDNS